MGRVACVAETTGMCLVSATKSVTGLPNGRITMNETQALLRPYSQTKRVLYGGYWGFVTLILAITLFNVPNIRSVIVASILAGLSGRYAYRIWSWQARHLVFFIIF